MDFIGRFESLQSDFQVVADRLHLQNRVVPHINEGLRQRPLFSRHPARVVRGLYRRWKARGLELGAHYTEWYTLETRTLIERLFQRDIEMFEYDFE